MFRRFVYPLPSPRRGAEVTPCLAPCDPEEPTDEVLQALMEKVAQTARESNARAEAEKRRRLQTVADEIKEWKRKVAI